MRVFAIGDPHLSFGCKKTKPMHIFGENWRNHDDQIRDNWNAIAQDDDLLLIVGDISWALKFPDAIADLEWMHNLKSKKVFLKGNHDFWLSSKSKLNKALETYNSLRYLDASYIIENDVCVVGGRGWMTPNNLAAKDMFDKLPNNREFKEAYTDNDLKIYTREYNNLKKAFEQLKESKETYKTLILALHYPPCNRHGEDSLFTDLIKEYNVDICVYGHLHGFSIQFQVAGKIGNCEYHLVSADSVNFTAKQLL